jgi:YHS domain-containing protein
MQKYHLNGLAAVCSVILLAIACNEKPAPAPSVLQKEIALGEKIFVEKECGKCHLTGDSLVAPEMKAPDLTSAFLANDTIFVKAHLQFIELSSMPPLDLTPQETRLLAKYVAHLHAKIKTDPNLKDPDGVCIVCGTPLKIAKAQAAALQTAYDGKAYYFDCADCERLFERSAIWYTQHGYLAMP